MSSLKENREILHAIQENTEPFQPLTSINPFIKYTITHCKVKRLQCDISISIKHSHLSQFIKSFGSDIFLYLMHISLLT
jgi:hypothetical protein